MESVYNHVILELSAEINEHRVFTIYILTEKNGIEFSSTFWWLLKEPFDFWSEA